MRVRWTTLLLALAAVGLAGGTLSSPSNARAQDAAVEGESSGTETPPSETEEAPPVATAADTETAAEAPPPPASSEETEVIAEPPTDAPAEAVVAEEAAAEEGSDWLDSFMIRVFADAFFAAHWTLPDPLGGDHSSQIGHRAYDVNGGLNLAFAGIDFRYGPDPIGITVDLRFGTAVPRLLGAFSGLPEGAQFFKQAFVSWRPVSELQIDLGEFDTIYGAEVSESWLNPNYTRGSLYNVVQPFYHTGLRVTYTASEWLTLTAIVVNGWNNILDNNDGKTGGIQARFTAGPATFALGYLAGPEQTADPMQDGDEDARIRHFVDAIASVDLGDLDLVSNADLWIEDVGADSPFVQWGVMVGARYSIIPELALAYRIEYLGVPDIAAEDGRDLMTNTFTVDVQPVEHLVIRLDSRLDIASSDRFVESDGDATEAAFSTVLGVVVHSD